MLKVVVGRVKGICIEEISVGSSKSEEACHMVVVFGLFSDDPVVLSRLT